MRLLVMLATSVTLLSSGGGCQRDHDVQLCSYAWSEDVSVETRFSIKLYGRLSETCAPLISICRPFITDGGAR